VIHEDIICWAWAWSLILIRSIKNSRRHRSGRAWLRLAGRGSSALSVVVRARWCQSLVSEIRALLTSAAGARSRSSLVSARRRLP
jgi:hypothetical protein